MKPYVHAKSSVKKWGGKVEDYLPIHDFLDSSKSAIADQRHRVLLHNSFGIFILEKVFGHIITNSDEKEVSVRDIGEQHIVEDLGFVPSVQDWLENMKLVPWMENGKNGYPSSIQSLIDNGLKIENDNEDKKEDKKFSFKPRKEDEDIEEDDFLKELKKIEKIPTRNIVLDGNRIESDPVNLDDLVMDGASNPHLRGRRLDNLRLD